MKREEDLFGPILFVLIMTPILTVVWGAVLMVLWGWFFVPLGLKPIGIAHAMGISVLIGLLVGKKPSDDSKGDGSLFGAVIVVVVPAVIALLTGWVLHLFM